MVNPLHSAEWIGNQFIATGSYDPERMTGRSTAQALHYLSMAINNPGTPVQIIDHHGSNQANINLMNLIFDIASTLGLRHINRPQGSRYRGHAYIVFGIDK